MRSKILQPAFFNRRTDLVARELLGKYLVRRVDDPSMNSRHKTSRLMITEVEVYDGFRDRASHASRGRTKRNSVMFGPAGYWYAYFTYGMHWMLNIVTREAGYPAGILIRGGFDEKEKRSINGPARLTKLLSIDGALNNLRARRPSGLWIQDRAVGEGKPRIKSGPRVGISYAGTYWARRRLRFWIEMAGAQKRRA